MTLQRAQSVDEERSQTKLIAEGSDFTADTTRHLIGTARVAFQLMTSMRASFGIDNTRGSKRWFDMTVPPQGG